MCKPKNLGRTTTETNLKLRWQNRLGINPTMFGDFIITTFRKVLTRPEAAFRPCGNESDLCA